MLYPDVPLWLSVVLTAAGLYLLTWSADKFVDASAKVARAFGVSSFIIGMVIIGFGTSAPELCVSALSGLTHHSDLSLGNAYGSCIFNLAAILGIAALIRPIRVKPSVVFVAVPLLLLTVGWAYFTIYGGFSRLDGILTLVAFAVLMPIYCFYDQKNGTSESEKPTTPPKDQPKGRVTLVDWLWLVGALALLIGSSHLLVWGSVDLARAMGVSELTIGLTVVAVGTSLPELASAIASARKGEHEFVLGNIVGSNLFNTLAVVGTAGTLSPFQNISRWIGLRDLPVMTFMSLSLAFFGINWCKPRQHGTITRWEGAFWILLFVAYSVLMVCQEVGS